MMIKPGFSDCIVVHATTILSFRDRLLLLLGRPLQTRVFIDCENIPGKVSERVEVWPHPIRWPWKRETIGGYEPKASSEEVEPR